MKKQITHFLALCACLAGANALSAQVPCAPNVTLSFAQTNVSCFGGNNGSATVTLNGSGGTNQYSWIPNGASTATASNLASGTYTAYVLNTTAGGTSTVYSENFNGAQTWTLNTPTGTNDPNANSWLISDDEGGVLPPGCGVANNGDATLYVSASGFGSGATYNAGGLCVAPFFICVNSNYRAESPNISTIGFTGLTLNFDYISVGDGLLDNASLVYSTNGGTSWSTLNSSLKSNICANGQGQWTAATFTLPPACENIANLRIGFVWTNNDDGVGSDPSFACNNIVITGASGSGGNACYVSGNVTITQPAAALIATTTSVLGCQGFNNSSATAIPAGGTPPYTYSWSNGQTTATIANLPGGNFTCVVTDANNCTVSTSVSLAPTPLNATTSIVPPSCNGGSNGSVTATVTNSTPPYTYSWSNGQTGATIGNLSAGVYDCVFTSSAGCSGTVSVVVPQPTAIALNSSTTMGSANVTATGGTAPYTYSWNTNPAQTTATASNLAVGQYTCTVTDANGCSKQINVSVESGVGIEMANTGISHIEIYPNPSEGILNWHIALEKPQDASLSVYDVNGKCVYHSAVKKVETWQESHFIPNLSQGVYFLKIASEKGEVYEKWQVK